MVCIAVWNVLFAIYFFCKGKEFEKNEIRRSKTKREQRIAYANIAHEVHTKGNTAEAIQEGMVKQKSIRATPSKRDEEDEFDQAEIEFGRAGPTGNTRKSVDAFKKSTTIRQRKFSRKNVNSKKNDKPKST